MRAYAMSQLSKVTYSRNQWKHKAKQRGDRERYRRKQDARNTAERNRITKALEASQARQRQLEPSALALDRVHCIGVSVADSWTGDTIAEVLDRLIAQMGRPAAYLKDGGSDLHKAVAILGEQGLASPCIDDISHAVAGMLKRAYHDHPAFATFVSACGRVSGQLKHTILACLAPPKVRTKARFMQVHRLFTWADRVLKLSPAGGAKSGSTVAKLRACLDQLPACKALIK